jgi:hypothetical protein
VASKYYRKYGVRLDPEHEVIACRPTCLAASTIRFTKSAAPEMT